MTMTSRAANVALTSSSSSSSASQIFDDDAEVLLWTGCGVSQLFGPDFVAVSTGRQLTLRFVTDSSIVDTGFAATYSQVLDG